MTIAQALRDHPNSPEYEDPGLPANIEAEQALLGALLYDNEGLHRLGDVGLSPVHFFEPFHGRMFGAIETHIQRGQLAEPILIAQLFQADPAFGPMGGIQYLADLVDRAPPAANAPDYARAIIELYQRRALIRSAHDAEAGARDPATPISEVIEAHEQDLLALTETRSSTGFRTFEDALSGALEQAAAAYQRDGGLSGLPTNLIDLDRKLGGLHPTDLIILAARPGMGKSGLAANIAFNVASRYTYEPTPEGPKTVSGGRVGFFSLEMSAEQLALRLLAAAAGVSSDRIRKGEIDVTEYGRLRDAATVIAGSPLSIDDTGGLSLAKLCSRARRMKRTAGLDLIVVDYLQLVTTGGRRHDNRVQEVSEITQGLKALAKELHVPVIALSQLSRQVESREDKRPMLSDLRESGSIEQDADIVAFIYREAYYLANAEPKQDTAAHADWRAKMDEVAGLAEIIIGKQRHGPIGTVRLHFNEDLTLFGNLAREGRYDFGSANLPFDGVERRQKEMADG